MNLQEFIGKMVIIIANRISYQGVLESDSNDVVTLIGEYDGEEFLIIIPKIGIDSILIPMGKHHE
jgi:hypothetical protein